MARAGYTGTSVREMAAGSGVSVAAMCYHFPSKHDLLREFLDQAWRTCVETVEDRLDEAPDRSVDRLDVIVGTLIELANMTASPPWRRQWRSASTCTSMSRSAS